MTNDDSQCDRALKAAEDAAAASRREKEERLERLAAVWDECESAGVKLGPSGFDEANHEQRNAFLPLADDEVLAMTNAVLKFRCKVVRWIF